MNVIFHRFICSNESTDMLVRISLQIAEPGDVAANKVRESRIPPVHKSKSTSDSTGRPHKLKKTAKISLRARKDKGGGYVADDENMFMKSAFSITRIQASRNRRSRNRNQKMALHGNIKVNVHI